MDEAGPSKKPRFTTFSDGWIEAPDYAKWIKKKDEYTASCKLCQTDISLKYEGSSSLNKHMKTKRHCKLVMSQKLSHSISPFVVSKESKEETHISRAELMSVFHNVVHGLSYNSLDCQIKLSPFIYCNSKIASKITCGRTKAAAITRNVLAPYSQEKVVSSLKENWYFSVSSDASNIGNVKTFPYAVQYFDIETGICKQILDFYEDPNEASMDIFRNIIRITQDNDLKIEQISAYSADNASVNYGIHNSVFQKLQNENKQIVKANCSCHIINNCIKKALNELSVDVENIVIKTFNEFSSSAKTTTKLKQCFEFARIEYKNLLRHVPTRWLSLLPAIDRLIYCWPAVKRYFLQKGEENCRRVLWEFVSRGISNTELLSDDEECTFEDSCGTMDGPSNAVQEKVVQELINRTMGVHGNLFEVSVNSSLDFRSFKISTNNNKIYINAYDGISAAKGFHHYIKYYMNRSIYWYNDRIPFSNIVIPSNLTITSKSESPFIYYQNVCTWGYSFVWWNWSLWSKHIDWMAMMGISLTIAPIQEYIWYETYLEIGLTDDEINSHISGPAFLPWFRMGNIRGFGGPTPPAMRGIQMILQKRIIDRQRMFGMTVAVPAFSGYLPLAMKRVFPNTTFIVVDSWNNFPDKYCCSLFLNSFEPLYKRIANRFLRKIIYHYGTDHIYFTDPFNEMQPQSSDRTYIHKTALHIFRSMLNVDENAIWLLQGWMFIKSVFWTQDLTKTFLTAVPKGRLLILDLQSEQFPLYEQTNSFYGQPFIWCMLHNFGGTLGMHGSSDIVNRNIRLARSMPNSSMVGVGITPEGINQNYVMYALVMERAWLKDDIQLREWFDTYSDVRYGVVNNKLRDSWWLLKNSVYSYHGVKKLRGKYVLARRPSTRLQVWTWYNSSDVFDAWSKLLECNNIIPKSCYDEYRYDLVDITRQYLQIKSENLYRKLMNAFKNKRIEQFGHLANQMLQVFSNLEDILATHEKFLLGTWLENAKMWSTNVEEELLFEYNARNQITLWGPTGEIVDYATKQWSGVVKDFFQPRWKLFLESLYISLRTDKPFNSTLFKTTVFQKIENPFIYQRTIYPTQPKGSTYNVSLKIFLKCISSISSTTTVRVD